LPNERRNLLPAKKTNTPAPVELEPIDCDTCDCADDECAALDAVETPVAVEAPKPVATPAGTYTAVEGDTYASVAANHPASGLTNYARAVQLHLINKGKAINAGTIIKL
jgi:hypothetical protein